MDQTEDACWTYRSCKRVMTTAHGGEWNLTFPYDSLPAFEKAYENGADAVKGDFRVSKDNIGVVMHSSPVEIWESLNCYGKQVEEMTAEECTSCQMEITHYHFITVPYMLSWAENKVNVMLCVKESTDIPRAITTLIENDATHRAFLEVHVNDFLALETNGTPQWDQVYYVVECNTHDDIVRLINASDEIKKRGFLVEFNDWKEWPTSTLQDDIALAESAGFRSFAATNDNAWRATVDDHLHLYKQGFDVAYTYNLTNAVTARREVNLIHGVVPP